MFKNKNIHQKTPVKNTKSNLEMPKVNLYAKYNNNLQMSVDNKSNSPFKKSNKTTTNLPDLSSYSQISDNFYKFADSKINNIMIPNAMDSEGYKYFKK